MNPKPRPSASNVPLTRSDKKGIAMVAAVATVLLVAGHLYFISPLGWMGYAGLFYAVARYNLSSKKTFLLAFGVSVLQGLALFGWMYDVANRYTGNVTAVGIAPALLSAVVFALKGGAVFAVFRYLWHKYRGGGRVAGGGLVLGTASAFVAADWLFSLLFADLPWMFHFEGYTQTTNLYFIQLAELGGVWVLTFVLVVVNLLAALALANKNRRMLAAAPVVLAVVHLYGFVRLTTMPETGKRINVALVCDNTPAEVRWDPRATNAYVHSLFALNRQALQAGPDLVVWNEGVIPWTYRADDDFVVELFKQSGPSKSRHLMSYYTVAGPDSLSAYNSAYLFNGQGVPADRYDKNRLLGGLEKPIWQIPALQLPFAGGRAGMCVVEGNRCKPVASDGLGKVGVFICNESLTDNAASQLSAQGAGFLVLMANDNWFANTMLIKHHFYVSRLRAVENRKDLVVNANMGMSGVVGSSGRIRNLSDPAVPGVVNTFVVVDGRAASFPLRKTLFLSLTFLILTISIIYKYEKN